MSRDYYYCADCGDEVDAEDVYWAFDDSYCDRCFHEDFRHCDTCDRLISEDDTYSSENSDGCYCEDCYKNESSDDEAPDNPDVCYKDIKEVLELANKWIRNRIRSRIKIGIEVSHYKLTEIQKKVGLVSRPINLYGLGSMIDFDLSVSYDIKEIVDEFIILNGLQWSLSSTDGFRRIGIGYKIRETELPIIVKLIKHLTKTRRHSLTTSK